jgi:hypothetical protein
VVDFEESWLGAFFEYDLMVVVAVFGEDCVEFLLENRGVLMVFGWDVLYPFFECLALFVVTKVLVESLCLALWLLC